MNDKILSLAKKLKALAEKGVGGEKYNAISKLNEMMLKHGLSEEDLQNEIVRIHQFKVNEYEMPIFAHVIYQVNTRFNYTKTARGESNDIHYLDCTEMEAIEIRLRYDFYLDVYKKELKLFNNAFIQLNGLAAKGDGSCDDSPLTPDELRTLGMMRSLKKTQYTKQLE